MKQILEKIFEQANAAKSLEPTEQVPPSTWLGFSPATEAAIVEKENELGVRFPDDYRAFLKLCNGYARVSEYESRMLKVNEVKRLEDVSVIGIEIWKYNNPEVEEPKIERGIVIGGEIEDGYIVNKNGYVLLIPPLNEGEDWEYWGLTYRMAYEDVYENLTGYFEDVLEFITKHPT